ncbi:hypothetical protein D3C87_683270 [compost metagenome]
MDKSLYFRGQDSLYFRRAFLDNEVVLDNACAVNNAAQAAMLRHDGFDKIVSIGFLRKIHLLVNDFCSQSFQLLQLRPLPGGKRRTSREDENRLFDFPSYLPGKNQPQSSSASCDEIDTVILPRNKLFPFGSSPFLPLGCPPLILHIPNMLVVREFFIFL